MMKLRALLPVPTAALAMAVMLSGCFSGLFGDDGPRVDTAVKYAAEICGKAGRRSQACADARNQASLRCYRTIGQVNCYKSEDPFGTNGSERSFVLPVDRRSPAVLPGDKSDET